MRLDKDLFDRLTVLAGKYSEMSPLGMKVGRATVAREAMMRGLVVMEKDMVKEEK